MNIQIGFNGCPCDALSWAALKQHIRDAQSGETRCMLYLHLFACSHGTQFLVKAMVTVLSALCLLCEIENSFQLFPECFLWGNEHCQPPSVLWEGLLVVLFTTNTSQKSVRGTGQLCCLGVGLDNPHGSLPIVDILQFWDGGCVWDTKILLHKNKVMCFNRWIILLKLKTWFLRPQASGVSVHRTWNGMEEGWCMRKESPFLFWALRTEFIESHGVQFLSWWQQYVSELWVCVSISLRSGRQAAVGPF